MTVQPRIVAEWRALAERFKPRVRLCDYQDGSWLWKDKYHPSSVEWFLERSVLKTPSGKSTKSPSISDLVKNDDNNNEDAYLDPSSDALRGHMSGAPFYVHIMPTADNQKVDIQYWMFYPYNGAVPTFNFPKGVFGAHEGDWERVRIRVEMSGQTIDGVYFGAHGSTGGWVLDGTTGEPDADHYHVEGDTIDVYSAWHSHACYPDRGVHERYETFRLSNDYTATGVDWSGPVELISIDPSLLTDNFAPARWLQWKGLWGSTKKSITHWEGESPVGPSKGAAWHETPAFVGWSGASLQFAVHMEEMKMIVAPSGAMCVAGLNLERGAVKTLGTGVPSQCFPFEDGGGKLTDFDMIDTTSPTPGAAAIIDGAASWADYAPNGSWSFAPLPGGDGVATIAAAMMGDGKINVFARKSNGALLRFIGDKGIWSSSQSLAPAMAGHMTATTLLDGSIFVTTFEGPTFVPRVQALHFTNDGDFTDQRYLPINGKATNLKLEMKGDGRLEIFATVDGVPQHMWQTSATDLWAWSEMTPLQGIDRVVCLAPALEASGHLGLFAVDGEGTIWRTLQTETSPNGWTTWFTFAKAPAHSGKFDQICASLDPTGRVLLVGSASSAGARVPYTFTWRQDEPSEQP